MIFQNIFLKDSKLILEIFFVKVKKIFLNFKFLSIFLLKFETITKIPTTHTLDLFLKNRNLIYFKLLGFHHRETFLSFFFDNQSFFRESLLFETKLSFGRHSGKISFC